MKQIITAVIRPKLNLSRSFNQKSHLIEHLLVSNERQKKINIDKLWEKGLITVGGYTSELYMVEYYISLDSVAESVYTIADGNKHFLYIDESDLKSQLKQLNEELLENRFEYITLGEHYERSIYSKNSPSQLQKWFDINSIKDVSKKELEKIFKENCEPFQIIKASFDRYGVSLVEEIIKNKLVDKNKIILTHPDQASDVIDVNLLIPYNKSDLDLYLLHHFIQYLADEHFGYLYINLVEKYGLAYQYNAFLNKYCDAIEINFSCNKDSEKNCIDLVKVAFDEYQNISVELHKILINRMNLQFQLDWGNISEHALFYLEEIVLSNMVFSPQERIKKLLDSDISEFNNNFDIVQKIMKEGLKIVKTQYSDKITADYY